jgi:hypothetical protein
LPQAAVLLAGRTKTRSVNLGDNLDDFEEDSSLLYESEMIT